MREVEAQPVGGDERTRLVHRLAKNLPKGGMEQVRRRVVPLRVMPLLARHARRDASKTERSGQFADRRGSAVDLSHVINVDAPPVADDLPAVRDLTAGLRVERCLAKQDGDATAFQPPNGRDLGLDRDRVVADERDVGR